MSARTFTAPKGTRICTQVDPMGLETLLEFEDGQLTTEDPGVIAVLETLAEDPNHIVNEAPVEQPAPPPARKLPARREE